MSNNERTTEVIRGKASYAKILGDPVLNYSKDGKEWKMDLEIDKGTEKEVGKLGIGDRVKRKDNYLDGKPFMTFRQREFRPNGDANAPIRVVDAAGNDWPEDKLIGNGSVVDVKFTVVDYGKGKKKGVYISSVRVLDLVPYSKTEFAPLDEDDEFYEAAVEAEQNSEDAERDMALLKMQNTSDAEKDDEPSSDEELNDELPV